MNNPPGEIRKCDHIGPDARIMELTKRIVEQNAMILKMNAQLLTVFSKPIITVPDLSIENLKATLKEKLDV